MLRFEMSILFRRCAQKLVSVNGCYVTEFFSHFGCRMGIARTEVQRVMCVSEKGDMISVCVSFYIMDMLHSYKVLAYPGSILYCTWDV